jgi:hypothetical protein
MWRPRAFEHTWMIAWLVSVVDRSPREQVATDELNEEPMNAHCPLETANLVLVVVCVAEWGLVLRWR